VKKSGVDEGWESMEETEEDALQESNRVISCSEMTGYPGEAIIP